MYNIFLYIVLFQIVFVQNADIEDYLASPVSVAFMDYNIKGAPPTAGEVVEHVEGRVSSTTVRQDVGDVQLNKSLPIRFGPFPDLWRMSEAQLRVVYRDPVAFHEGVVRLALTHYGTFTTDTHMKAMDEIKKHFKVDFFNGGIVSKTSTSRMEVQALVKGDRSLELHEPVTRPTETRVPPGVLHTQPDLIASPPPPPLTSTLSPMKWAVVSTMQSRGLTYLQASLHTALRVFNNKTDQHGQYIIQGFMNLMDNYTGEGVFGNMTKLVEQFYSRPQYFVQQLDMTSVKNQIQIILEAPWDKLTAEFVPSVRDLLILLEVVYTDQTVDFSDALTKFADYPQNGMNPVEVARGFGNVLLKGAREYIDQSAENRKDFIAKFTAVLQSRF